LPLSLRQATIQQRGGQRKLQPDPSRETGSERRYLSALGAAVSRSDHAENLRGLDGDRAWDAPPLRVYNPARTVAYCFKFRNKIGVDVAMEVLRDTLLFHQLLTSSSSHLWM
jgi:hypothetical protein